jgi:hypothetical protein
MPVRRDSRTKRWFFRTTIKAPDGRTQRLFGTPGVPGPFHDLPATKIGAIEAEQRAIREVHAPKPQATQEVPTFSVWFKGRFWKEWVVGRCNKPSEVRSKNGFAVGQNYRVACSIRCDTPSEPTPRCSA